MIKYNIVWFDDEFNTSLEAIKMQFDDSLIAYEGFESAEEGIKYIQSNHHKIDAIVIDGNFFRNKEDNAIDDTGKALNMVVDVLKEIKFKKDIPYFVLSGKVNFRERRNQIVDILDIEKVYDKLNDDDLAELCNVIIEKSNTSLIGSLKIRYHDVFVICAEDKLGEECFEKISCLAQSLDNLSLAGTSEDLFLPIRKLLEKLFVKLSKIEVIDPELVSQKGWINGSSYFLSNRHASYESKIDVHPIIQDGIFRLLNIIQDSAHAEGGLKMKVDEYCNQFRSNYLYKSSVYLLFEILTYFGKYIDENQDMILNRSRWTKVESSFDITKQPDKSVETISGTVTKISSNGYGTFLPNNSTKTLSIIPSKVEEFSLFEGQKIKVKTEIKGEKTHITHIQI